MSYWIDKNIVELDDMLEHMRTHAKSHFYETLHEFSQLVQVQDYIFTVGGHCQCKVHLNGYIIKEPGFILYFDKEQLFTWNGKYVPKGLGDAFTLN